MNSTRRQFLHTSALATAWTVFWGGCQTATSGRRIIGANDRLNIGCIGTANRAASDIAGVKSQNIVALCDVDESFLASKSKEFPSAKTYRDFRRLLEQKDIDAVTVGTPDHTHAVAAVAALRSGRHVYCEKPLTRTVSEARIVRNTARQHPRLATQMGNQIHASANYRRVVELVQSGAIGPVKEVHVWSASTYGHLEYPKEFPTPPPANLDWDLWLGPVTPKPYHPDFAPFKWRNWWAFGGGSLADFGCHYMDLPHWALELRGPLTVEAVKGPQPADKERPPVELVVKYEYPARGAKPPVTLFWYQGGGRAPMLPEKFVKNFRAGVLFIGAKGMLLSDYGAHHLFPEQNFIGVDAPKPWIPDSIGHHEEWILACKTGTATLSNFEYAGALSEAVLLGNVAHRAGCKLEWDAAPARVKNCPAAEEFVQHHYRKGWKI
ncbi:MAG: Gfo/Idh/MocA family oxidoreductase [Verrucomicrobia bacterium]|nr:Gfo/Idh/MocA family oxidoreductase [Verrucomicrobiota bacterium]